MKGGGGGGGRLLGSLASTSGYHLKQAKRQVSITTFHKCQSKHAKDQGKRTKFLALKTSPLPASLVRKLSNVFDYWWSELHKASIHTLQAEQAKTTTAPLAAYTPVS